MPKVFTSETQKTGEIGENVAVKFLMKQDFEIIERNYTKKWGEIDIVAKKGSKIHFIEVKSVVREDLNNVFNKGNDGYRPEDNMHTWKMQRMARTIQTYLISKKLDGADWQIDLLVVYLSLKNKTARVKVVKDIIL